jgi:hypothetical protein
MSPSRMTELTSADLRSLILALLDIEQLRRAKDIAAELGVPYTRAYAALEQLVRAGHIAKRRADDSGGVGYRLPIDGECMNEYHSYHRLWRDGQVHYHCDDCREGTPDHFPNHNCPEGCVGCPTGDGLVDVRDWDEVGDIGVMILDLPPGHWKIRRTVRLIDREPVRIELVRRGY